MKQRFRLYVRRLKAALAGQEVEFLKNSVPPTELEAQP